MSRKPLMPTNGNFVQPLKNDEIDCAYPISAEQLKNAKIVASREDYIDTLPSGCRYMEVGVAWGYYSEIFINQKTPKVITLLDWYNQDLRCWSWRKFGECTCIPQHTMLYTPETHMEYIKEKFAQFNNVEIIKGNSQDILPTLNKEFDYIYLDITNDRNSIRPTLHAAANLVPVGGIIGLNDYLIYDGIIEEMPYATYQVVHEFLYMNKNWEVDAIALHVLGFNDIYIKRIS
jgi:hypothetical protein